VRLAIVAVGKLRHAALRALVDEYLARVRRHVRCDEIEVGDAAAVGRALPGQAFVVALDPRGDALGSVELARRVERWASRGKGVLAFVIGGAEGLPAALIESAGARLSLSSLTLPHRLARLLLAEQLYRTMTILRGEPYAREG
jgi:23S rRNA (pseudouridine1915-N3)-methyltransferase